MQTEKRTEFNRGKGGYTLVELCVVLALVAIVATMIVSFSAMLGGFSAERRAEYAFTEDRATLRDSLCDWVAEQDRAACVFTVGADGSLSVTDGATVQTVQLADGTLTFGTHRQDSLDAIDGITFSRLGTLIKCEVFCTDENGVRTQEASFVFVVRCAQVETGVSGGA